MPVLTTPTIRLPTSPLPPGQKLVLVIINTVKRGQLTVIKQEQVTDLGQSNVCMTSCGSMFPTPHRGETGATTDVVLLGLN